jgi:drug/metabolite transporter (DMT)-like permease
MTTRSRSAPVLVALAASSWALSTVLTKITLAELSPRDLLGIELAIGTATVWALLVARGGPRVLARWRRYALLGVLEPGLSFALFDLGLNKTGAADGALLLASESVFAVALAWLTLGEPMHARTAFAVVLGFSGAAVIGLDQVDHGASLVGDGLVLGASLAAAAYAVGARHIASDGDSDPLTVTAVQLLTAALLAVPLMFLGIRGEPSRITHADPSHLLCAVATGLLGSAIPFVLYNIAIRDIDVTGAALILNLIPVFGVVLAVVLVGEHPSWVQLAGGAAIIFAALGVEDRTSASPVTG